MSKVRMIPYGYEIILGEIAINKAEENIVKFIYNQYIEAMSYKKIAELLTEKNISYRSDKNVWNKNMVARILQNKNYLGNEKYPQIISQETYDKVIKSAKPYTNTLTDDIKEIKPLLKCEICGSDIARRIKASGGERWFCTNRANHISLEMTDEIIKNETFKLQDLVKEENLANKSTSATNPDLVQKEMELDFLLTQENIDATKIRALIMEVTELKLNSSQKTTHLTNTKLQNAKSGENKLLVNLILQINIKGNRVVSITLKNGIEIRKE